MRPPPVRDPVGLRHLGARIALLQRSASSASLNPGEWLTWSCSGMLFDHRPVRSGQEIGSVPWLGLNSR